MKKDISQAYRASIGAIIFNSRNEFLLVQLPSYRENEWDFVKGGMQKGEKEEETLVREIREEIGENVDYVILRKSIWNIIYEWPIELQVKLGFRGQARISFWVKFNSGVITIPENEVSKYRWVSEDDITKVLIESRTQVKQVEIFMKDWELLKDELQVKKDIETNFC